MNWFWVGLGGMLGSLARYGLSTSIAAFFDKPLLPYGIIVVNVLGCFLIGLFAGLMHAKHAISLPLQLFLMVGFLGGFTTFSAFGLETFQLLQQHHAYAALMDVLIQVGCGTLAVAAGFSVVAIASA
jgi:fluoride exporter